MNTDDLRDYRNWVGKDPATILKAVMGLSGWAIIFPQTLPIWASRVRNYFNVTPKSLKLLDEDLGDLLTKRANKFTLTQDWKAAMALTGEVYQDKDRRLWYTMKVAGAVYHYEGEPGTGKSVKATVIGQKHVPVFKLISPDGSGGSKELCVNNWQLYRSAWDLVNPIAVGTSGEETIGPVGKWIDIRSKVVIDPVYRGTYNYSETIKAGFAAHESRDVKPHSKDPDFYVDPPMYSALEERRFPETDGAGKVLADQA